MSTPPQPMVRSAAPILILQPEILSNVVLLVHKDASGMRELMRCSHICGYWRKVVLNLRQAWAVIRHDGCKNKSALLALALQRSGNVPLDITVSLKPKPSNALQASQVPDFIDSKEAFVQLAYIVEQFHRIRKLDMIIGGSWPERQLTDKLSLLSLPLLERLHYSAHPVDTNDYLLRIQFPHLRIADFINIFPQITSTSFPSLETLIIRYINLNAASLLLAIECLPYLQTLELWFVELLESTPTRSQRIRFPSKLYFRGMTPDDIMTLMGSMNAGAEDVTSYAPLRAWNYFIRIYDILAFQILSDISSVSVQHTEHSTIDDGPPMLLTLTDCAGRRRAMTIPAHIEAVWKNLATKTRMFDTADHWDMYESDLIAIQKFHPVFSAATEAEFRIDKWSVLDEIPTMLTTSWPMLRTVRITWVAPVKPHIIVIRFSAEPAIKLINSLTAPLLEVVRLRSVNACDWEAARGWISPLVRLEFEKSPQPSAKFKVSASKIKKITLKRTEYGVMIDIDSET